MRRIPRVLTKAALTSAIAAVALVSGQAQALVAIADAPLFITVSVAPNIVLTLDDSGSMARSFVPDICGASGNDCSALDGRYAKSAYGNPLYYNPKVKYVSAKDSSGDSMSTTFGSAYRNGFDPTGSLGTVDLSKNYVPTAALDVHGNSSTESWMAHASVDFRCSNNSANVCQINKSGVWTSLGYSCSGSNSTNRNNYCRSKGVPAYYYVYDPANASCTGTTDQKKVLDACYDMVQVSSTSGAYDLDGDGVVSAAEKDERQNFANWFSFARTRNLATATAASLAFSNLDPTVRVAWEALNTCNGGGTTLKTSDCRGWQGSFSPKVSNAINTFSGTHKDNFYKWLSRLPTQNSTPLPAAMDRVGRYYQTSGEGSPYDNDFTTTNSGELSCRRNYHVMMTDGIWNQAITAGDRDGTSTALPNSQNGISQYSPIAPYKDTYSDTLADIAFKYWITDLRGTLSDNIQGQYKDSTGTAAQNFWNPRNDPATWQHMVNFTIGLGLSDYLTEVGLTWGGNTYAGSYASIAAGTKPWPQPASDTAANVADLWHAAINSRGQFFNAGDPSSLSVAFQSALTAISSAAGSTAALSANSTSLNGSTLVYQAKFDNKDWSGKLIALTVNSDGSIGAPQWDASQLLPSPGARKVFSYNGTAGVQFSACTNLGALEQSYLNHDAAGNVDGLCTDRLNWLRGTTTREVRFGGPFRNRTSGVMGDIVNSDPAYVYNVDYGYSGLPSGTPGQSSYSGYVSNNSSRPPMVYVGANDGHLYAIRADTGASDSGQEKFSYIPRAVFPNLSWLMDPSYTHKYFVDGSVTAGDAYIGGSWKSVVLGGLNAGGKSVYALDVSNPGSFDASKVLWEFDPSKDLDANTLGYTFSQPQVGILENGQWVAIFGNGYSSTNGGAYLYVVDLQTGALIRRIAASDLAGDEENGLSTPRLVDLDGNKKIDTVYAGDLQGNLWKFDLSGSSSGTWGVVNNRPLFQGVYSGLTQPITSQPKVIEHPMGGQLILFGTGRYLANADVFDTSRQTFYGIWDSSGWSTTATRANLQPQTFTTQKNAEGRMVRVVSSNSVDWAGGARGWYLDLLDGGTTELGERVVHSAVTVADLVLFSTIVPSTDPCTPGGTSWLIALKAESGGALPRVVFDLDRNKLFDDEYASAVQTDQLGITNTPSILYDDPTPDDPNDSPQINTAHTEQSGSKDNFESMLICLNTAGCSTASTHRSWIQIR